MKKIAALALSFLLLYGCTPNNTAQRTGTLPESTPGPEQTETPASQHGLGTFQGPDDFVILCGTRGTLGIADQAGHIFTQMDENMNGWLIRTDPETQTTDYICRIEGCAHNTEACAAFCYGAEGAPIAFEWDNTLFIVYSGNGFSPPGIETASPDGTNRQPLWVYEGELEEVEIWQLALYKNFLYMVIMGHDTSGGTVMDYMARVDLHTSQFEILQPFQDNLYFEACLNGELMLRTFEAILTPDENGNYPTMRDSYIITISYNPQTGKFQELERYDNREQQSLIQDGLMYTVHYDDFSVTRRPLGSTEEEVICTGYTEISTQAVHPRIEVVLDDKIIISDIRGYGVDPYTVYTLISEGQPQQWEICGSEGNFYVQPEYSFGGRYLALTGWNSVADVPEYKLIDAQAFWNKDFSGEILTRHIIANLAQNADTVA